MLADRIKMSSYKGRKLIDRTAPTLVINQPYSTEGNGGRKLGRLKDGRLVSVLFSSLEKKVVWCISKDMGETWIKISENPLGWGSANLSLAVFNNKIYTLQSRKDVPSTAVALIILDVDTFERTIVTVSSGENDTSGGVSLVINPDVGELHACWSSKNSSYPNSFNIRYRKGIINGDGSVTWGSVEQVNVENNTNNNSFTPTIVVVNNLLIIIYHYSIGAWHYIMCMEKSTGSFTRRTVFNPSSGYLQSSPSACVDKDGVIHVVWHGMSPLYSINKLHYAYSLDGGITWNVKTNCYVGTETHTQEYPSISTDKEKNIYVGYNQATSLGGIIKGSNYMTVVDSLSSYTNKTMRFPSLIDNIKISQEFPMFISMNMANSKVDFYGKWYE